MKIIREINDMEVEFVLTNDELFTAYLEQQYAFDVQDVMNLYGDFFNNEEVEAIANEARRQMDKYDIDWGFAINEAISKLGFSDRIRI